MTLCLCMNDMLLTVGLFKSGINYCLFAYAAQHVTSLELCYVTLSHNPVYWLITIAQLLSSAYHKYTNSQVR